MADIEKPYVRQDGSVVGDDPAFDQAVHLKAMEQIVNQPLPGRFRLRASAAASRARRAERQRRRDEQAGLEYATKIAKW